jgi:hypothetical protein
VQIKASVPLLYQSLCIRFPNAIPALRCDFLLTLNEQNQAK